MRLLNSRSPSARRRSRSESREDRHLVGRPNPTTCEIGRDEQQKPHEEWILTADPQHLLAPAVRFVIKGRQTSEVESCTPLADDLVEAYRAREHRATRLFPWTIPMPTCLVCPRPIPRSITTPAAPAGLVTAKDSLCDSRCGQGAPDENRQQGTPVLQRRH